MGVKAASAKRIAKIESDGPRGDGEATLDVSFELNSL